MKKNILKNFTLLLLLSLSACATKPPDFPICVEMSLSRGECIHVISGKKVTVNDTQKLNDKTWWESRPTNIVLPLESFQELKKWVIKVCKKNSKMCDKEVSSWERSLDTIESTQELKTPMP